VSRCDGEIDMPNVVGMLRNNGSGGCWANTLELLYDLSNDIGKTDDRFSSGVRCVREPNDDTA